MGGINHNTPKRQAYMREYNRLWWLSHPEYKKAWRKKNPDKVKAETKARKFKPGYAEWHCKSNIEWAKKNRGKCNAKTRAYKLQKNHATPKWVDLKSIEPFYIEADTLTSKTGIKHHVDHVWPIQGKTFSGLHVPWNLQILTASQNSSKQNTPPTQWTPKA